MVPSYSTSHSDYVNVNVGKNNVVTIIDGQRQSRENGLEARIASDPDSLFKWIIGANYYRSYDSNIRDVRESEQGGIRTINEDAMAFFANVTYPVMDKLRMTGGYRQSWDDFKTHNIEARPMKGNPSTLEHLDQTVIMEYSKPDYKIGFEYDLGESIMVYGDHATSYRVRGMSGSGEERDPERLKAFTLGAKSRFFGNKLQANIAAYYYDYTNYAATQNLTVYFDTDDPPDGVIDSQTRDPNSTQDGDGRFIGVDLQTSTIISSQDRLDLSISWEDSEWTDLFFDYYYEVNLIENETGGYDEVVIEDASYNGKPMTNTPPWTISANYSHNFFLPNDGTIKTALTVRYQTDYLLSWKDSDFPNNYQESYRLADFNAAYTHPDGNLTFSVYVSNIENYAVKRGIYGVMQKMVIGEPRTYGAVLSLRF
jgi:iron complex outermembrane receptor protein